jgi:hypothetical protein
MVEDTNIARYRESQKKNPQMVIISAKRKGQDIGTSVYVQGGRHNKPVQVSHSKVKNTEGEEVIRAQVDPKTYIDVSPKGAITQKMEIKKGSLFVTKAPTVLGTMEVSTRQYNPPPKFVNESSPTTKTSLKTGLSEEVKEKTSKIVGELSIPTSYKQGINYVYPKSDYVFIPGSMPERPEAPQPQSVESAEELLNAKVDARPTTMLYTGLAKIPTSASQIQNFIAGVEIEEKSGMTMGSGFQQRVELKNKLKDKMEIEGTKGYLLDAADVSLMMLGTSML